MECQNLYEARFDLFFQLDCKYPIYFDAVILLPINRVKCHEVVYTQYVPITNIQTFSARAPAHMRVRRFLCTQVREVL